MSVMLISQQSFKNNLLSLYMYYSKINYGKKIHYEQMKEHFENLYSLNVKSWNARYPGYTVEDISINLSNNNYKLHGNLYSLLKSLQCLNYQIEIDEIKDITPDEQRAYNFLQNTIERIKDYIITETEEYKNAEWA